MTHHGPGVKGQSIAWAIIFLFALNLALAGANLLWTAHAVTAVRHQFAVQAAVERGRGAMVEHKICLTLHRLAALKPPAGNPETNPSRAYAQEQHRTLSELAPDLGCPK